MRLPHPVCLALHIWYGLRGLLTTGIPISGHDYLEISDRIEWSTPEPMRVQTLRCLRCDHVSEGWQSYGPPMNRCEPVKRDHDTSSRSCWCMPHALPAADEAVVIVHHYNREPCEVCAGDYEEAPH